MVRCKTGKRGSQCGQLEQCAGSTGAGVGSGLSVDGGAEARAVVAERATLEPETSDPVESGIAGVSEYDPSELVSSLLGALVGDPWADGLLETVWQGRPVVASEIVSSPALLERLLAVAERALESSGSAACSVSAWMAEHNGEVEDWMASMSTVRQPLHG